MSSYKRLTKHPITGEWKNAWWLDDFFGHHRYGVRFTEGDDLSEKGETFREEDYEWETKDEFVSDTIQLKEKILKELELAKSKMHGGGNHRMIMEMLIEKIKKY